MPAGCIWHAQAVDREIPGGALHGASLSFHPSRMITIRATSDGDAELLPEIERSSGTLFRDWAGLEWIADDRVQSPEQHRTLVYTGVSLVAEDHAHRIVGFLNGEMAPDALHIYQVAVHPGHQRQGIGRRLIERAQEIAAEHGVNVLTLTTFRDVPWNQPYYLRLGFETMPDAALNARLRAVLDRERAAGLPSEQRCAMIRRL